MGIKKTKVKSSKRFATPGEDKSSEITLAQALENFRPDYLPVDFLRYANIPDEWERYETLGEILEEKKKTPFRKPLNKDNKGEIFTFVIPREVMENLYKLHALNVDYKTSSSPRRRRSTQI